MNEMGRLPRRENEEKLKNIIDKLIAICEKEMMI